MGVGIEKWGEVVTGARVAAGDGLARWGRGGEEALAVCLCAVCQGYGLRP